MGITSYIEIKISAVTGSYIPWMLIDGETFGNFKEDIPQIIEKRI
jgi:hypothetical protein